MVTALHDGRRRVVAAADQAAAALGLRLGMAIAQALALVPDLDVREAEPAADGEALRRLALWCHRYTPLVAVNPSDGLWLDIAGCTHAFGSEAALLDHALNRLARDGLHARTAVADTPGAAHALARHGRESAIVVPPGTQGAAIAPLPVAALRLPPELEAALRRLGFEQVSHLARIPRALLARRFGPLPGLRLDQAHGRVPEPLTPLPPEQALQRRITFLEPLLTAEALQLAITHLTEPLCAEMEREGSGARQLDLLFERVDNQVAAIRIGTARPSRDARHLARLLEERLDTVDPGLGIEAMHLLVSLVEPLSWEQQSSGAGPQDVSRLVDRLTNRLGPEHVYRLAAVQSDIPERIVRKTSVIPLTQAAALEPAPLPTAGIENLAKLSTTLKTIGSPPPRPLDRHRGADGRLRLVGSRAAAAETEPVSGLPPQVVPIEVEWKPRHVPPRTTPTHRAETPIARFNEAWQGRVPAPARLLSPPRLIRALAALPDQPPVAFTWRRRRHLIRRADGPERIAGEWWSRDKEMDAIRDYFTVEDQSGQRFWLFRQGNGLDPRTGSLEWFLHGLF